MLVTIDESGDPGFKIAKGSSPVFVMAMVIFAEFSDAERTAAAIKAFRRDSGLPDHHEFKFNKSSDRLRAGFFNAVAGQPFKVRSIVIDKARIYSPHIRSNKDAFYHYFLKSLLRYDGQRLQEAVVKIDRCGDRTFRDALASYLRKHLRDGAIRDLKFSDSKGDVLIQLADMCAGAIGRAKRSDGKRDATWTRQLSRRIEDIWDFK